MTRTLHTRHSCRGGVCVLLVLKCRDAGMRPKRLPRMPRSLGADSKPAAQQAEKMRKTESQMMQRLKRFKAVIFRRGFWSSPQLCGGDRGSTHWLPVVLPIILEPITCRTDHWHHLASTTHLVLRFFLIPAWRSTLHRRAQHNESVWWPSSRIAWHLHAFACVRSN